MNILKMMYIKIYLVVFLVSLFNNGIIKAQWNIEKSPTTNDLNAISLINNNNGWIVGDKGTLLFKVNSIWREYQKPTNSNLYSVFMVNGEDGWAVGAGGTILHFDGKQWRQVESPTNKRLLYVCFKDSENGIATGEYGTVLFYKNGIWSLVNNELIGNYYTASYDNDDVWIGGWRESVSVPLLKLEIDERLKIISRFDHLSSITGIAFLNSYNGWAVGSPSFILHYNGIKWERWIVDDNFSSLNSLFFYDENNGIAVGYKGTVLTYDGIKWVKQKSPTKTILNGSVISRTTYFAVGDSGTIISWNKFQDEILPERNASSLEIQVYPNPSDEILNYILPIEGAFKPEIISILDILGQVVFQKNLEPGEPGTISQINISSLDKGIYLLIAKTADGKKVSGKFIIDR
jgi:photosystem II stability/assembly factor-like uncharacterized protein